MKKLALVALLACLVIAPIGCRALMVGTAIGYDAFIALVDPVDSGHFWSDFGDYLDGSAKSMRRNMKDIHRTFDRYFMLYDWDDPTL